MVDLQFPSAAHCGSQREDLWLLASHGSQQFCANRHNRDRLSNRRNSLLLEVLEPQKAHKFSAPLSRHEWGLQVVFH
jgi:hypothetical protein